MPSAKTQGFKPGLPPLAAFFLLAMVYTAVVLGAAELLGLSVGG